MSQELKGLVAQNTRHFSPLVLCVLCEAVVVSRQHIFVGAGPLAGQLTSDGVYFCLRDHTDY